MSDAVAEAAAVSELVCHPFRTSNRKDYSEEYIGASIAQALLPEHIAERATWTHFCVACKEREIIGFGAIGPYWGKADESCLFTVFVHPAYQGQGRAHRYGNAGRRTSIFCG